MLGAGAHVDLNRLPCPQGGSHRMFLGCCNKCGDTDIGILQESLASLVTVLKNVEPLGEVDRVAQPIIAAMT